METAHNNANATLVFTARTLAIVALVWIPVYAIARCAIILGSL